MTSIQKTLIEIQETQSFDKLEPFKDPSMWEKMATHERHLLAQLLIRQGAQQLSNRDEKVFESFDVAVKVAADAPQVYYQQGQAFAAHADNSRCLRLAAQSFERATNKDPDFVEAWYAWAKVLMQMGNAFEELPLIMEAHAMFEKTSLMTHFNRLPQEEFFWRWGNCCYQLGRCSGEPSDFYLAVGKFQRAAELGCVEAAFYNDYGNAIADMGALLEKAELFAEALVLFEKCVLAEPSNFDGWYNRACCLCRINQHVIREDGLDEAYICFEQASLINPENPFVWLKWGQLEVAIGKLKRDSKCIEAGIEKFARGYEIDPTNAMLLSCWGETEVFLGSHQESLETMRAGQAKIEKSLQIHPENPELWYLYGYSFNELGHYFSTADLYEQAVEKFQRGLGLTKQHPFLWHGMAVAHCALGELNDDLQMLEKAVHFHARAMDCGGEAFPQFWNDWGVALMKLAEETSQPKKLEQAIEKFEKALKLSDGALSYNDIDIEWAYNYGCAFDLLGNITEDPHHFERSVHILTQVVNAEPNYLHARYNLALALAHLGEAIGDADFFFKAVEQFHFLIEKEPEDEMAYLDLGVAYINWGLLIEDAHDPEKVQRLYNDAEATLQKSASLGSCQAYYQLAGLYSLMDNNETAMHYIEKAHLYGALPPIEELLHDEWLDGLRQMPAFRQFIAHLSQQ